MSASVDVHDDNYAVLSVEIPPDHEPGSKLEVETEDGRVFSIVTNDKTQPGQRLNVRIPVNSESGSTVVVSDDITEASPPRDTAGTIVGTVVEGFDTAVKTAEKYTLFAFQKVKETADKYHIPEKIKTLSDATVQKAREIDEEYKVTEKVTAASHKVMDTAKSIDDKYKISDQATRFMHKSSEAINTTFKKFTGAEEAKPAPATAEAMPTGNTE